MKNIIVLFFAAAFSLCNTLAAEATEATPAVTETPPDATIELKEGSAAIGVGYVWGHGKVTFKGVTHAFTISGVSLADVGAASITATGEVTHLATLSDFSGNYVAWDAGLTLAGGASATYLKNEHGVVIKLVATTAGLRFNLATDGVRVQLKS